MDEVGVGYSVKSLHRVVVLHRYVSRSYSKVVEREVVTHSEETPHTSVRGASVTLHQYLTGGVRVP